MAASGRRIVASGGRPNFRSWPVSDRQLTTPPTAASDRGRVKRPGPLNPRYASTHKGSDGVKGVQDQYERYHEFAHLTRLTIAAGADLSRMGVPQFGAFFDAGKLHGYLIKVRRRTSFARVLPNLIAGVARDVAGW